MWIQRFQLLVGFHAYVAEYQEIMTLSEIV